MPDKKISQLTPTTTVDLADQYALARGSGNFHVSYNTLKTNLSVNTSSFVKTVNAVAPDSTGNVTVSLTAVETGTSASMRAYSSSGLFTEGDVWVISGESGSLSSSNGDSYIYSGDNTLLRLSGLDTAGNDTRYVNVSGDTMTGDLILNGAPTTNNQAATKAYVDGLTTNGTNGQTIRFNGTTPTSNSFLFNNGSQIGVGTTTPKANLHVNSNMKIGSSTLNRDYMQVVVTGGTGSIVNVNEVFKLHASGSTSTLELRSDARDIEIIPGDEAVVKGPLVVNDGSSAKSGEQIKITTVASQNPGIEFDAGAVGGNIFMSGSEGNFYVGSRAGFPDNSRNISADEPTLSHHLTTKNYVDGLATGTSWAGGYLSGQGAYANKYDLTTTFNSSNGNISWSAANDEWTIAGGGTFLISTNGYWQDVNSKTVQIRYSTTAGTGATGGTLLAAQAADTTARRWDFFATLTTTSTVYLWVHNLSGTGIVRNWKIQIQRLY